jgi:virulence factor
MLRLGIVDFDSSHSVEFTKRLNHQLVGEDQWVEGARVVAGCVLPSAVAEQSRVEGFVRTFTRELGLPLVDRPEELLGQVDGVLIEAVDGSVHLERARPFLEAGIPTFVDKPFACSLEDAREMFALAQRSGAPLFSCSSLRYAPEVAAAAGPEALAAEGAVLGCDACSPASTHPRNPGLFHYGVHGVETLFTLMGPGCETVWCVSEPGAEVVLGRWSDGRLGTLRGTRAGAGAYAFTAFREKRVSAVSVSTNFIYRELLKQIVEMMRTGTPPIEPRVTLEIVAFMQAALHSAAESGAPRPLGV